MGATDDLGAGGASQLSSSVLLMGALALVQAAQRPWLANEHFAQTARQVPHVG